MRARRGRGWCHSTLVSRGAPEFPFRDSTRPFGSDEVQRVAAVGNVSIPNLASHRAFRYRIQGVLQQTVLRTNGYAARCKLLPHLQAFVFSPARYEETPPPLIQIVLAVFEGMAWPHGFDDLSNVLVWWQAFVLIIRQEIRAPEIELTSFQELLEPVQRKEAPNFRLVAGRLQPVLRILLEWHSPFYHSSPCLPPLKFGDRLSLR